MNNLCLFGSETKYRELQYPLVCAHRGLSGILPENTLPAFAAGIAAGADEIEFDILPTRDGQLVISHDAEVDRITDYTGAVESFTLAELQKMELYTKDKSVKTGIGYCSLQQVFEMFGRKAVMNMHFKKAHGDYAWIAEKAVEMIRAMKLSEHVYLSSNEPEAQSLFLKTAPEIARNALEPFRKDMTIVDLALEYGCSRCQLFRGHFDGGLAKKAIHSGLICNVFWADDIACAREYLDMGIKVILSNRTDLTVSFVKQYNNT